MKAIFSTKSERTLVDREVPQPAENEVLIKNVVVSSNPKDWKLPIYMEGYEAVEGNDVAGTVESVGSGVSSFKPGDKVAAFSKMRTADKYGAYAEYTVAPANTTFHLGPKTNLEDAVTLPLAYMTAAIGLFKRLELPTPDDKQAGKDITDEAKKAVLVWGASSTVGVFAVQLAKKAGLHVVGIAGAASALAKSYGCDELIDYRNKSHDELAQAIKQAAGGKLRYAYDAISEKGSLQAIAEAFKEHGGQITYVLTYDDETLDALPKNVTTSRTLVATAHSEDADFAQHWYTRAGEWLESGAFRGMKVTIIERGLEGVDEGLKRLQEGKASGEKFVYRVADTPSLKA